MEDSGADPGNGDHKTLVANDTLVADYFKPSSARSLRRLILPATPTEIGTEPTGLRKEKGKPMAAKKIMVIRHAEKPVPEGANGVEADGRPAGPDSLSAIGWDRARALVNFFAVPTAERIERPDYVFAAAVEVSSQRPRQTVSPLAASLRPPSGAGPAVNVQYPKEDIAGVTTAVMSANGIVLICWEHKMIPPLVAKLFSGPGISTEMARRSLRRGLGAGRDPGRMAFQPDATTLSPATRIRSSSRFLRQRTVQNLKREGEKMSLAYGYTKAKIVSGPGC